jgi:hypothetical protein
MKDLEYAKELLSKNCFTCVLCKGNQLYTSNKSGVAPLLDWLDQNIDLSNFSVADKIVGKASAMLLILSGVSNVYAPIMGKSALAILTEYKIEASTDNLTEYIVNRNKNGPCPMEDAVSGISDPKLALVAIKTKIRNMQKLD